MISQATNNTESGKGHPTIRGMSSRRFGVLARSDFHCAYCGLDLLTDFDALFGASVDHVKPRRHGGSDDADNLVAACRTCNQLKGDANVDTIEEACEVIRKQRGEWLASFVGHSNVHCIEFPRQIDQIAIYAPDMIAALGMCAAQARWVTGRLQTIMRNAAALEALLGRYEVQPAEDQSTERTSVRS